MADDVTVYLQIDSIKGGATRPGNEGWIPIRAFVVIRNPPGPTIDDQIPDTSVKINFAAPSDVSFARLMRSASELERFDTATIEQRGNPKADITVARLANVVVLDCRAKGEGFYFTLGVEKIEYGTAPGPAPDYSRGYLDLTDFHGWATI